MKGLKTVLGAALALGGVGTAVSVGVLSTEAAEKNAIVAEAAYSQGSVIANNKARIWIGYDTSNPFYSYADASTGIRLWIHSTSSGGEEIVYGTISGEFDNSAESNRRYDYFDVDLSVYTNKWYMTVQKFQGGNWKASTNPIQLQASNAFKVYYVWGDWAWDKTQGTVDAGGISSVDAGLVAKALGGMHTCSPSAINGYNAFPNFNSTFVKDGENWKTSGNLGDYEVTDFANGNTSYTGSPNTTTNAYTKYAEVQDIYTANKTSSRFIGKNISNNTALIIVTTVGGLSIISFGAFLFIRKRKHQK